MRSTDATHGARLSYVSLENGVPKTRPLRRLLVDGVLASMPAEFCLRFSHTGRPSVAPKKPLRALLPIDARHSMFCANRERLQSEVLACEFF